MFRGPFFEKVKKELLNRLKDVDGSIVEQFMEELKKASPPDLPELATVGEVLQLVESMVSFFQKRSPGEIKVEVVPGTDDTTLVKSCMDDQIFIIDTITLWLNNKGYEYRFVLHPIVNAIREKGVLKGIGEGGIPESINLTLVEGELCKDDCETLSKELKKLLSITRDVVGDFSRMKRLMRIAISDVEFRGEAGLMPMEEVEEIAALLEWALADKFVFLGGIEVEKKGKGLKFKWDTGLGVCRKEHQDFDQAFDPEEVGEFLLQNESSLAVASKLDAESTIHRAGKMDLLAVQMAPDDSGKSRGWYIFLGLLTKSAVLEKGTDVPMVRNKLKDVARRLELTPGTHSYREAVGIFNTIPVEALFLYDVDHLAEVLEGVLGLGKEFDPKVFTVEGGKGIHSILVVMPQDRYSSSLEEEIEEFLCQAYQATYSYSTFSSLEGEKAFIHYFISTPVKGAGISPKEIETKVRELSTTWTDQLNRILQKEVGNRKAAEFFARYKGAFNEEYRSIFSPHKAYQDLQMIERLIETNELQVGIVEDAEGYSHITIFSPTPLILSKTVPILGHMFLQVLDEVSIDLKLPGNKVYLHAFRVLQANGEPLPSEVPLADALVATITGRVESDPLNQLVVKAALPWDVVDLLRTYRNYLRQIAPAYTKASIYNAFLEYPEITTTIWDYFDAKFNPLRKESVEERQKGLLEEIHQNLSRQLDQVQDLSSDKIFRIFFNMVESTIRTNFYKSSRASHYISVKINCGSILEMPLPRPMYEIYVHEVGMEGVHLRGGKVARGGIRWSDRPDDFRTEILGLMKTQMVKNAIIVPTGSKGGFIIKVKGKDREETNRLVTEKYTMLMKGMLDITDNVVDGKPVHPDEVVCYDGYDPYLVVAADKGTAHLSDTANSISQSYGYWLDDAFASGGSAGYDHKKLGITAKGAWVNTRRHFMEMGIDPNKDKITVVGIGDMGGDVFGNGMLLSQSIKLVGAFNHIHIFMDPDPDPLTSWKERERLFKTGKGWDHYNKELISEGGGVFSRQAKSVPISPQMQKVLDTTKTEASGEEVIRMLLKAPVDLVWNGGIGTYVKASTETHQDVGDHANDNVRIDANQLRTKVVGEGGNLGFTQRARVEYALRGGFIYTDALDNSAGVDMSDHEVNLKILFQEMMKKGKMSRDERNRLLEGLTPEVVDHVLRHNYEQSLAVSLDAIRSKEDISPFGTTVELLIKEQLFDPADTLVPDSNEIAARKNAGEGLFKPELALLLGHVKRWVKKELEDCEFIDAPYLNDLLASYFPHSVQEKFPEAIEKHLLRREILINLITNNVVNQAGQSFFVSMRSQIGATPGEVAAAYMVMDGILGAPAVREEIRGFDFKVPAELQYKALIALDDLVDGLVRWALLFGGDWMPLKEVISKYNQEVYMLVKDLPNILTPAALSEHNAKISELEGHGISKQSASLLAAGKYVLNFMDVVTLAEALGTTKVKDLAVIYTDMMERFQFFVVQEALKKDPKESLWEHQAYTLLEKDLWEIKRTMASQLYALYDETKDRNEMWKAHRKANPVLYTYLSEVAESVKRRHATGLAVWSVVLRRIREALQG